MAKSSPLPPVPLWLGLTGWIPFWIPVLLTLQAALVGRSAAAEGALFVIYGAIILGFLGGVRWGRAMASDGPPADNGPVFILSIMPSLAGLAAVLLFWSGQPLAALALILIGLIAHWRWDHAASQSGELPAWYGRLRVTLTVGAAVAAIAMLALYPLTS